MQEEQITLTTEWIKLDALLKFAGAADTGGKAKQIIAAGDVQVNGAPCAQRGKKLRPGDIVTLPGIALTLR